MRPVLGDLSERTLAERARLGLDRFDEIREGVLHVAPAPGREHQRLGTKLVAFLEPLLQARGIQVQYETEVHRPGSEGKDYRIPDLVFFRDDQAGLELTERGLEGAPLAVLEILSPDDETYQKLDFYAALGIAEVIVVKPEEREVEVYRLAGERHIAVPADGDGRIRAASIDVRFSTVRGTRPALRVECDAATRDV